MDKIQVQVPNGDIRTCHTGFLSHGMETKQQLWNLLQKEQWMSTVSCVDRKRNLAHYTDQREWQSKVIRHHGSQSTKFNSEVDSLLLGIQVTMTWHRRLHLADKQPKSIPGLAPENKLASQKTLTRSSVKSQCQSFWCQDPVTLRLEVLTVPHLRLLLDSSMHSWLSHHHRQC